VDHPLCFRSRRLRLQRFIELFRWYCLEHRVVDYYHYFLGTQRSPTLDPLHRLNRTHRLGRLHQLVPQHPRWRRLSRPADHLSVRTLSTKPGPYKLVYLIHTRRCRQLETVEALGWTALGLSAIAILAGCFAYRSHRRVVRTSSFFPFLPSFLPPPFLPSVSIANEPLTQTGLCSAMAATAYNRRSYSNRRYLTDLNIPILYLCHLTNPRIAG
jgi:hypothetical protein